MPFSRNQAINSSVLAGSARSALHKRTTRPFPAQSASMSGFRLLRGILASTSSITRSTRRMFSSIIRLAFVICPGYHCTSMFFSCISACRFTKSCICRCCRRAKECRAETARHSQMVTIARKISIRKLAFLEENRPQIISFCRRFWL